MKRILIVAALFVCCLSLTSCADHTEVNDMNVVVGLGLDETKDGMTRVTAEFVNPQNSPISGGQGGSSGGSSKSKAYFIRDTTGPSLEDAIKQFDQILPHRMYMAHNTVVVFGATYLKHGIERAFDYLERNRYLRRNQMMIATTGSANRLLAAPTDPEPTNAFGLRALAEQAAATSPVMDSEQLHIIKQYLSPSHAPVLIWMDLDQKGRPMQKGVALLHGGKIVDYLDLPHAEGLFWLKGETHQIQVSVPCANHHKTTFRIVRSNTKVTAIQNPHHKLTFIVSLQGTAEIESFCSTELFDQTLYQRISQQVDTAVLDKMRQTMKTLQTDDVDAVQFAAQLYRHHPQLWRKLKGSWNQDFTHLPVSYHVHIQVERSGLIAQTPTRWLEDQGKPPRVQGGGAK
ncbi:Ger(x)C family spore germination protein [Sulfoacidibacillus thermotolerans]|uniref:Uncharacterized protein n=1 Tax=Sulfoacidibacillus thermotolerans TaxID=1765684 RepID=A0A2U3D8E4_SULT2|nr:Ger(x)C family spore germination protein [Sulfoacidibacillus thermotolerans]PWI57553.1 hypothetical protein BM613_08000 [Sulfoacidibacillus thermotolerans]